MIRLKLILTTAAISLIFNTFSQNPVTVSNIRCESKQDPIGIEVHHPHLSWVINSMERDVQQTAYHVLVADNPEKLKNNIGNIWDSKKINSSQSIQVLFKGKNLNSGSKYFWKLPRSDSIFWRIPGG